jgi:hypothetical protein
MRCDPYYNARRRVLCMWVYASVQNRRPRHQALYSLRVTHLFRGSPENWAGRCDAIRIAKSGAFSLSLSIPRCSLTTRTKHCSPRAETSNTTRAIDAQQPEGPESDTALMGGPANQRASARKNWPAAADTTRFRSIANHFLAAVQHQRKLAAEIIPL